MKKIFKIMAAFTVIILTITINTNITIGTTISDLNQPASSEFNNVGNTAVKVISIVGMIVSVVTLILLGIKYMAGSMEQRAEYKRSLLPYFIGALFVFGASGIASIVYNIAKDL